MSLSYQPLEPVLVKDPRCIINNKRVYSVLRSGKRTTFKRWTTNSVSTSNINFSTPPPASNIIVDRKITMTLPFRLEISMAKPGGGGNTRPLRPNFDALRAFPLHSMLNTIQLTINNCSMTQNIGEIIHALLRYNFDQAELHNAYSTTPCFLDNYSSYNNGSISDDNPLAAKADSSFLVPGRGAFATMKIVSNPADANPNGVAIVDCVVTEQIMLSPLYWGKFNASGFTNVTSMDWVFNFLNNVGNRAWSHATNTNQFDMNDVATGPYQITGIRVAFSEFNTLGGGAFSFSEKQPTLNITYITPEVAFPVDPNQPITYPYFNIDRFVTAANAINSGTTGEIVGNSIQLSSIPRRVYVFVRPANQTYYGSATQTDCFLSITQIQIQFGNDSTLLAEASQFNLYEMSRKNHCNLSWDSWSGNRQILRESAAAPEGVLYSSGVGSVICIEFATDIGLEPSEAPGVGQGTYTLSVKASVANNNPTNLWDNRALSLYVVPVLEGTFTITQVGSAQTQNAVLSVNDVETARYSPMYNYNDVQEVNGGNFMSGLKNLIPKVTQGVSKANKFLKDNKIISTAADVIGFVPGVTGDIARDVGTVAKKYGYGVEGGVVLGGKKMSKAQLQNRLRNR